MPNDGDGGDSGTDGGDVVRADHDWSGAESVSMTILRATEGSTGRDARSFEPLNDVVDTDALDNLFATLRDGSVRGPGYVAVEFEDHTITVHSDGEVVVAPRND